MAVVRITFRFFWFLLGTVICVLRAGILKLFGAPFPKVYKSYVLWKSLMIFGLNLKVELAGSPPKTAGVIMANHRSYVDVLFIKSLVPLVFVAKASVKKWPLVGWGGTALSTVWVDRSSKESRRETRRQLSQRLKEGISVVLFPEGTTHRGPETLPFKPGMFHSVAKANLPVFALAIEYEDPKIAWVDDDLFLPHFFQVFSKPAIRVKIKYSAPITSDNGELLQQKTQDWITRQLLNFRKEWEGQAI